MAVKRDTRISKELNISLMLDSYTDIFSDFDPRPFQVRALSDDFLNECKKAAIGKGADGITFELRLLIPARKRNAHLEGQIRERLHNHFHRHHLMLLHERKHVKRIGIRWFILGAILLIISGSLHAIDHHLMNYLIVASEPAGWFTMWTGLERVFIDEHEWKNNFEFYEKMSRVKMTFIGI